jgi:hypothetical protein
MNAATNTMTTTRAVSTALMRRYVASGNGGKGTPAGAPIARE